MMSPAKLQKVIDNLRDEIGDALISCDVWMAQDGFPIASYQSLPKAVAFFNRVADNLMTTLEKSEVDLPNIGEYFYVKLADDKGFIIVLMDEYRISLFFDLTKVQLGFMFNVMLPQFLENLEEVLVEA